MTEEDRETAIERGAFPVMPFPLRRFAAAAGLLALLVAIPACSGTKTAVEPVAAVQAPGNLIVFSTAEDFTKGLHEGTEVSQTGNGGVALKEGVAKGAYTSPEIETKPFEYLVLSWNAGTPEGTYIEDSTRFGAHGESGRQHRQGLHRRTVR